MDETVKKETLEEYLARGGKILVIKPMTAKASRRHKPRKKIKHLIKETKP